MQYSCAVADKLQLEVMKVEPNQQHKTESDKLSVWGVSEK